MAMGLDRRIPFLLVIVPAALLGGKAAAALPAGCPACPWAGIFPTVVTPFCGDGVDVASLECQIRYQLQGGCRGLLLLGTIGEGQYATMAERAVIIRTAVCTAGPAPVIVGIHTCNLGLAQAQLAQARDQGAAAVLVKYLGNPRASAGEVLGFYAALCEMHALPIFYYHYPGQTHLRLSARDVANILCLEGVVGIKESTLNFADMRAHICLTRGLGKCYFTSTALNLTQYLEMGGSGAMCPEAVLLPAQVVREYDLWVHACVDDARALQKALFVLAPVISNSPLPVSLTRFVEMRAADRGVPLPLGARSHPQAKMKAALNCLGVPTPTAVKCPLPPLSGRDERTVARACSRIKSMNWCGVDAPR